MTRPIYQPKGRALEYCDLAVNIYDSCPHLCSYCYARGLAARFGKPWGSVVSPRPGIVEAVRKQLTGMRDQGKLILLCFTCDPYPRGHDSTPTREMIRAIKESGNHVQILTKGDETAQRDFDLLDRNDWFGVTFTGGTRALHEPNAAFNSSRSENLHRASQRSISTWVSCEPVFNPQEVFRYIREIDFVDLWRIGKLNHLKSDIDWSQFGHDLEALCRKLGRNYVIKHDLRVAMGMSGIDGG